mmetsp:Transcript_18298/g.51314  ORF Transcript_18298/g.51314 Transcript_18298/m.51314 type:complete len:200 (-) Transcript_18298:1095-1694(-)
MGESVAGSAERETCSRKDVLWLIPVGSCNIVVPLAKGEGERVCVVVPEPPARPPTPLLAPAAGTYRSERPPNATATGAGRLPELPLPLPPASAPPAPAAPPPAAPPPPAPPAHAAPLLFPFTAPQVPAQHSASAPTSTPSALKSVAPAAFPALVSAALADAALKSATPAGPRLEGQNPMLDSRDATPIPSPLLGARAPL